VAGAAEFTESCRRRIDDDKTDKSSDDKKNRYEYPIQLGLKNGYQELVMRSPGRYELALLLEEDRYDDNDTNSNDVQNISENNDNGGAQQYQVGAAATNDTNARRHERMTTSAAALQKEDCCYIMVND